jgi:hypothetical protein
LLGEDGLEPPHLSFTEVQERLHAFLSSERTDIASFGDKVGWTLEPFAESPTAAWEWNASGLHDICEGLGLDWRGVLAWLPGGL